MNPVLRDKCWARRFGRTPGDLGIVRPLRRDRVQIAIWRPQQVAPKVSRVTVPKPLPPCAISPTPPPSGRVGRQSDTNTLAGDPAKDWFDGPECAAILAQPVEPCTGSPFAGDCEPSEIDA